MLSCKRTQNGAGRRCLYTACLIAGLATPALSQTLQTREQPLDRYPEGAPIPRSLTPEEAEILKRDPLVAGNLRVAPPGLVRTPAEYDPCEAIMIAWEGTSSWLDILANMASDITTLGDARVIVWVDTASEQTTAANSIASVGANMAKVEFRVRATDTIWIRDYGPRYIMMGTQPDGSGGVRAIVDHTYNRPRPNDNALPSHWASLRNEPLFLLPLIHGGGNYHLESGNPAGIGHATNLIVNENPPLDASEIIGHWRDYLNLETTLYTPYPTFVDSTQHIDMWMILLDDNKVMVSQWVNEPTASWAITSDNAAAAFASRGFTVYRVPAVRSGGTHYTFTNAVICNDLVLIPSYTNATAAAHNATALATWQIAYPGKTIRQINSQAIVTSAGVLHCIVMHVPAAAGGTSPTAYITTLNEGIALDPGTQHEIRWLTDDDVGATTADLLLSTDGGQTFTTLIAADLSAPGGLYNWTVPDVATSQAVVRIVVRDADNNSGFDDTDMVFAINGSPPCPGDFNGDGEVNFFDVSAFLDAFSNELPEADLNGDGEYDFFDVSLFLAAFSEGCP